MRSFGFCCVKGRMAIPASTGYVKKSSPIRKGAQRKRDLSGSSSTKITSFPSGPKSYRSYASRDPGILLNPIETRGVKDIFYSNIAIQISADSFRSILFKSPFTVHLGARKKRISSTQRQCTAKHHQYLLDAVSL